MNSINKYLLYKLVSDFIEKECVKFCGAFLLHGYKHVDSYQWKPPMMHNISTL